MNKNRRLEILEAFAQSKGYEFTGFTMRYLEQYPEQPEPIVATAVNVDVEADQRFQSDKDATLTVSDKPIQKPKEKRTRKAVPLTESESNIVPRSIVVEDLTVEADSREA